MAVYTLTPERAAAYAKCFDFRTPIVRAARVQLEAFGIAAVGPGEGVAKTPRYFTSCDFVRGAATGRKCPVALGGRTYMEFCEFLGVFSIMNTVPMETDEKSGEAFLSEEYVRELDRLTSLEDALFMEHISPFAPAQTPLHEVTSITPMEPDERPEREREVNVAFRRWQLKVNILYNAWPTA